MSSVEDDRQSHSKVLYHDDRTGKHCEFSRTLSFVRCRSAIASMGVSNERWKDGKGTTLSMQGIDRHVRTTLQQSRAQIIKLPCRSPGVIFVAVYLCVTTTFQSLKLVLYERFAYCTTNFLIGVPLPRR